MTPSDPVRPAPRGAAKSGGARRWFNVFDCGEEPQFVCDSAGAVIGLNRKAAALMGAPSGSRRAGLSLLAAVPPALAAKLAHALRRHPERPEVFYSALFHCPDSPALVADLHLAPLDGGEWLATLRDSGGRGRNEPHERRLEAAVEATPDVWFLADADFKLTFVNPSFQAVTGHGAEDALGRTPDFLRAPSESGRIREYTEAARRGMSWRGVLTNARRDGSKYAVHSTVSPVRDRAGHLSGYAFCERESAPESPRGLAESVLDSLPAAVYCLDREFRLVLAGGCWKRFAQAHGWLDLSRPPAAGDFLLDRVPDPVKRAELLLLFESVLATGRAEELSAFVPGGSDWQVTILPRFEAGEIAGLIYQVSDQTVFRESQSQSVFRELQSQLFESQKMETIGALAAGMAHDFNNLLQVIHGHAVMALGSPCAPSVRSNLENVEKAAERAGALTRQLLSFSRASDGSECVFDFNHFIVDAGELVRQSLKNGVELALRPCQEEARIEMNTTRAHQLLLNLCVNAQDAMPRGGRLAITNALVRLTEAQAPRTSLPAGAKILRCSVSDTGTGIPPEVMGRIFEPFFTTKESGKGTGLGLSIAQKVAAQAGGFIEVESALGVGTTFHIYFPTVDKEITATVIKVVPKPVKLSGRIMVVDDLDLIRDFTKTFLTDAGFEVMVAGTGQEALQIIEDEADPVDLLFADYNMPGLNGAELIELCAERWPSMKFVLASGNLDESLWERLRDGLGVQILRKPYNIRDAVQLIQGVLAGESRAEPPR